MNNNPLISLFKEQLEHESAAVSSQYGLDKRGDFLIWWYFLRVLELSASDIAAIICDGGNDLGIDAIYIDDENYVHFYQFKNPEKLTSALPAGEVDKLLSGLQVILNRKYAQIANAELKARLEDVYKTVPTGYRLHLVTSGMGMSPESRTKLDTFVESLGGPTEDFFTWQLEDVGYLQDVFYRKKLPSISRPIIFRLERQAPYQVRSADHDCYMFHSSGGTLAQLYSEHGEQLLQQNIRVFQGDQGTNSVIRETCTGPTSANFFHYNNGVTFLCETAQWDQFTGKLTLVRAQIVNGGQTIRVLYKAHTAQELKSDVLVPVRVITSQGDKEFASNVAVNLNNQNRVETSFLRSNDPRIVQLAHSMESLGWYLERREDEVKTFSDSEVAGIEHRIGGKLHERTIKLKDGAQAYAATFFRQPELAKSKPGRIFLSLQDGGVFERMFSNEMSAEKVIQANLLKRYVDAFVLDFMSLKRKKARLPNWRKAYSAKLNNKLVREYGDLLDQVIPQSSVFLCALLFENYVILQKKDPKYVVEKLGSGNLAPLLHELTMLLEFAKTNPSSANKGWPTLLKSQSFFDNVASYIKGRKAPKL